MDCAECERINVFGACFPTSFMRRSHHLAGGENAGARPPRRVIENGSR